MAHRNGEWAAIPASDALARSLAKFPWSSFPVLAVIFYRRRFMEYATRTLVRRRSNAKV
jgi:hypothetical protein